MRYFLKFKQEKYLLAKIFNLSTVIADTDAKLCVNANLYSD